MKRNYKEKDFQSDFNRWCKNKWQTTAVFELKVSPTDSLPFDAVQEHQSNALYNAKHESITFKIPDGTFTQSPFDSFHMVHVEAYVVIMFNCKERNQKEFFMIDIDNFILEKEQSERKSLTKTRASEIGSIYLLN